MKQEDKSRQTKVAAAVDELLKMLPDDLKALDAKERTALLKELLPYTLPKKATTKEEGGAWADWETV